MPSPEFPAEEALQRRAGLGDQRAAVGRAELLGAAERARLPAVEGVAAPVVRGAGSERLAAKLRAPLHRQSLGAKQGAQVSAGHGRGRVRYWER